MVAVAGKRVRLRASYSYAHAMKGSRLIRAVSDPHNTFDVFRHMFFSLGLNYRALPDPRTLRFPEVLSYYRALLPSLVKE